MVRWNAEAIFWRSAGLGVQRPMIIAATRPSSSPVCRARSAAEIFCRSQRSATLATMSEVLLQPKPMVADVSRVHVMPPTDLVNRDAEGCGDLLAFCRTGSPAADGDGLDPFGSQPGTFGDVFDCQVRFLE